ncbi:hypothetical protein PG994_000844 [Apiospora phragmitis]|uniref:Uncharacterized protein n=1 Tax=Apiospora phragmitis TaxID=2905665 RepID=A0ABR1X7N1_9PEZI
MLSRIVIFFVGLAAALPGMQLTTAPRADATISKMIWRGQIEAGGPEMNFTGTIQEVVAQIRQIKPDFPAGLNSSMPLPSKDDGHEVDCNVGGSGAANPTYINDGIDYLHVIPGNCGVSAGNPGTCARISCSYNAGIWLCSENGQEVLWSCYALGDIAENDCFSCIGGDGKGDWCSGREKWPEHNFHVDVGWVDC